MKRISILLILALIATLLLTACGGGVGSTENTTDTKAPVTTNDNANDKESKPAVTDSKAPETTEPLETDVPLDPDMPANVVIGFKSQDDVNKYLSHGSGLTYAYDEESQSMKITCESSSDPILVMLIPDQMVNMDYFRYMKIRVNAETVGDRMEIFYSNHDAEELVPKSLSSKFTRNQWTDIVFDLTDVDTWTGFLNVIRYDPLMASTPEDYILLEYIGFFRTMEDAEAYTEYVETEPFLTEPVSGTESSTPEA